ncbi:MAG: hypothetical protein AAF658_09275 [Myxococcota bacterium]
MKGLGRLLLITSCALSAACGSEALEVSVGLNVRVSGLTQSEVTRLEGFVFDPRLSSGSILPCFSLLDGSVDPRGSDVVTLSSSVINVNQGVSVSLNFAEVDSGEDRVILVESFGLTPQVNGRGCAEGITVDGGGTTRVGLVVQGL